MLRLRAVRNRKEALKVVKELDAFPKVPESYQETTVSGGGISIVVFVCIIILVVSEFQYYTATELKFNYDVDTKFNEKLKINVDITVAMKCAAIGADVLDLTGENAHMFGRLQEEDVHFELSPKQAQFFSMIQGVNDYVRKEYHAIQEFLWQTGYMSMAHSMPAREDNPTTPPNGCRIHGTLTVNKVAGNFHITAGKSVPVIPKGHAHLSIMVHSKDYNFSHRIDHFSYGDVTPGIVNPLDGELKVTTTNYFMYQYFIQVVPTTVKTATAAMDTFQFAVTEQNRTIDHSQGSHGVPGIFVKYDMSSLKVSVREEHKPYWQFLIRLCGIIGGIFATSGILHSLVGMLVDLVCCRYKLGKYSSSGDKVTYSDATYSGTNNLLQQDHGASLPQEQHLVAPQQSQQQQQQQFQSLTDSSDFSNSAASPTVNFVAQPSSTDTSS